MSEPTIDEMLEYLEDTTPRVEDGPDDWVREFNAIRAILEQHRDVVYVATLTGTTIPTIANYRQIQLEAIRAFVERVFEKYDNGKLATELPWDEFLEKVLQEELAAMEKEAE